MKERHNMNIFVIFILIGMVFCSCASYPRNAFDFPILVLHGGADITIAVHPFKTAADEEAEWTRPQYWRDNWEDEQRKKGKLSPSERDYVSKIRLPVAAAKEDIDTERYSPFTVLKEYRTEGEVFSMRIPQNTRIEITVTNNRTDPLVFLCSKRQFLLDMHESKTLIFR